MVKEQTFYVKLCHFFANIFPTQNTHMHNVPTECYAHAVRNLDYVLNCNELGPVVQSVVSLTSSLRVISLTVLADSIYYILIIFAEKNVSSFCIAKATHIFSAKNFSIFA